MDILSDASASAAGAPATAPATPKPASIRDRLKEKKDGAAATQSTTLPVSGIAVTYPGFVSHEKVMSASKLAGKNASKVGIILVAQVCLFEGERLTVDEIGTLLHNRDTLHLINLVFGEDDSDEEGSTSGN